jgi:predicted nucleotidyltransferase
MNESIQTAMAAFLARVPNTHRPVSAWLFGSQARGEATEESDIDVAVVLEGQAGPLFETVIVFSDIAFDVMMDTGTRLSVLPLWTSEWENPESASNPRLIYAIQRDGIPFKMMTM